MTFMRGMRKAHARFDAYSHHPYPVTPRERPSGFAPGVCRYCTGVLTLATLPVLLREVRKDFGRKRIWLTEYGYQSRPPDRFGVSRRVQAQYLADAALRAKNARGVDLLVHFMVRDEPRLAGWQSGLFSAAGLVKPAFNSFKLPIAQMARRGLRTTIWGQVRPGSGRRWYRLQRLSHGRWASVGRLMLTNARGSYTRVVRAGRHSSFRVVAPTLHAVSRRIVIH